jgi:hypothetical protein
LFQFYKITDGGAVWNDGDMILAMERRRMKEAAVEMAKDKDMREKYYTKVIAEAPLVFAKPYKKWTKNDFQTATFYKQGPDPPPDQRITGKKVAAIKTHYEKLYKGKPGLGRKALWTASQEKELQRLESGDVGSEKEAIIYSDALETQNDFIAGKVLSMSAERRKHILGRVFNALSEEERKSLAHLITGQEEAPAGEPPSSEDDSSIADDATLVENCGTNNVAARADALLLEWDQHDEVDDADEIDDIDDADDDVDADDVDVDNVDADVSSAASEQGNADDDDGPLDDGGDDDGDDDGGDDGDDGIAFGDGASEEGNEQEEEQDSDDSMLAAESHGDETIVEEDSAALAHAWVESIKDREEEFMSALNAKEISKATMVAMLVEIGAFENDRGFMESNKDCQNLLYEWGTARPASRPYILLNKDQLLEKAKDLGIKGVRAGWKEQTICTKLREYHAAEGY